MRNTVRQMAKGEEKNDKENSGEKIENGRKSAVQRKRDRKKSNKEGSSIAKLSRI